VGEEIERLQFSAQDFRRFEQLLAAETEQAQAWMRDGRFDEQSYRGGFELEAWLLDRNFFPEPRNEDLLRQLNHPLVVPELSRFNIELNGTPQGLSGQALRRIELELTDTWRSCVATARDMECQLAMIGTLPTIRQQDLTPDHISNRRRYHALNEQVLKLRNGRPFELDIRGREHLRRTQADVLLEAVATSFQVHLQVPASEIHRYYNAAQMLSAPLIALSANSPFLFGLDLWDETRIPLFEQAVAVDSQDGSNAQRVTFGSGYLEGDPIAVFRENQACYPVLLPIVEPDAAATLRHLRLHNGTIWRWNRLLMGFEDQRPSLRVEHRILPAGPSIVDQVSNAAVYIGASRFLAGLQRPPEEDLPFDTARENFYAAARDGIAARVRWLDGRQIDARSLLLDEILHMARQGLLLLGVDEDDIDDYIGIAEMRVRTGQNGTAWQRAWVAAHGRDFFRMIAQYLAHQHVGNPVHEWPV
jgi:gamma-glutamyl:cysteine ligase YbdK (ATP-grasp superfamily)